MIPWSITETTTHCRNEIGIVTGLDELIQFRQCRRELRRVGGDSDTARATKFPGRESREEAARPHRALALQLQLQLQRAPTRIPAVEPQSYPTRSP